MTLVKICGITRVEDAAYASSAGADFIGLNFWPRSKRFLHPTYAPSIIDAAHLARADDAPELQVIGVFVDPHIDDLIAVCSRVELDGIQLHGDESPDRVRELAAAAGLPAWKAVAATDTSIAALDTWPVDALLLDTPSAGRGGSGHTFDWSLAVSARSHLGHRKLLLAGGLIPSNVAAAVAQVAPWAVDVASGVESAPGIKDHDKIAAFIGAARG
ncbi:MAG TPA: phosphoribosylanthranilate isomerase [Kofleriaceae bacterium]|jgi:phosphoribosylanthranilate isomerase